MRMPCEGPWVADRILEWDFDRMVMAHEEVVETSGRDLLRQGYSFLPPG